MSVDYMVKAAAGKAAVASWLFTLTSVLRLRGWSKSFFEARLPLDRNDYVYVVGMLVPDRKPTHLSTNYTG